MFQFPTFASLVNQRSLAFNQGGCPIRISVDQCIFAPPHRFSQLITSFIASESLGIPHTPFSTSFQHYCMCADYLTSTSYAVTSQQSSHIRALVCLLAFSHVSTYQHVNELLSYLIISLTLTRRQKQACLLNNLVTSALPAAV